MAQVLRHLPGSTRERDDPNLLVGTETFDDAGVYRLSETLALVQTVDFFPPLVDDPFEFGRIAAANALSDIYAMGAEPRTAMNLVCFPDDKLPLSLLSRILAGGQERITAAGAVLVGGHTVRDGEIKYGLSATGVVDPARMTTNAAAAPGDVLFLTKPLGTGFVTTAAKRRRCPESVLAEAVASMTSLNNGGAAAMRELEVRAATDVTGFGLAGHANEMAAGSRTTLAINVHALPLIAGAIDLLKRGFKTRASKTNASFVHDVVRLESGLDPLLLEFCYDAQTSGGLLMAVPERNAALAADVLRKHGVIVAARIGSVEEKSTGKNLILRR